MTWLPDAVGAVLLPPAASSMWCILFRRWVLPSWGQFLGSWISSASFGLGYGSIHKDWPWAVGSGIAWLICAAIWLYRRRKRRRAAAPLGAKSRALRERLIRTMRRERRPSRVLRPHPVPS